MISQTLKLESFIITDLLLSIIKYGHRIVKGNMHQLSFL